MSKTNIGGQAVIEGVYMRSSTSSALAVRDCSGTIRLETKHLKNKGSKFGKLPFVRGVVNLGASLGSGTATLLKSAEVAVEEEFIAADNSSAKFGFLMSFASILGVAIAIGLFFLLPNIVATAFIKWFNLQLTPFVNNLLEGGIKFIILISYLVLVSQMKDIKRVFMYHGAEHKTINCYESDMPLTVENVQKCSTIHDRCGTSFTVYVVIISIIVAIFFGWSENLLLRLAIRLLCIIPIAAVSYELLKLLAKTKSKILFPLKWVGWQMQKITTKQPTDEMTEVAIAAFKQVLLLDSDEQMQTVSFEKPIKLSELYNSYLSKAAESGIPNSDIDWLICDTLDIKRSLLTDVKAQKIDVAFNWQLKISLGYEQLLQHKPLQYIVGSTEFFGRKIKVNKGVLIPRMETELLAEKAISYCLKGTRVLDLCCGSGAIAIAIASKTKATVYASDISNEALEVAKYNIKANKVKVKVIKSDMFSNIKYKFDVIVCNPPYIKTADIDKLDANVKDYEPRLALDGGIDGLNFYRILAQNAVKHLTPNGTILMEIGYDQANATTLFMKDFDVSLRKDYSGNDRIIIARRGKI